MNDLKILFEDKNLAVLDKPAGLIVHSAGKNKEITLVDLIIKKWPEIKKYSWPNQSRPGIVHRLDKDTSGLILIAKNPKALEFLQDQFMNQEIDKEYLALCLGKMPKEEKIETYTSHDPKKYIKQKVHLLKLSWHKNRFKKTVTYFWSQKYYNFENQILTLAGVKIITGRTHQIRNHLKYFGYPIIGDQDYFTKESLLISKKLNLKRQFLHSKSLDFTLINGKRKKIIVELPLELINILNKINKVK